MLELKESSCPIRKNAIESPDKIAIESQDLSISYQKLDELIDHTKQNLLALKLPIKGKVGIYYPNDLKLIILIFALLRCKQRVVIFNPKWPSFQLKKAIEDLNLFCLIGSSDALLQPLKTLFFTIEELIHPSKSSDSATIYPSEIATVVFTSGSSSFPKPAALSIFNHMTSAKAVSDSIHLLSEDRYLLSLPLYHVSGLGILFRCIYTKATLVMPEETLSLEDNIIVNKITHISMVSTQLYRILTNCHKSTFKNLSKTLKCLLLGGSPIGYSLYEQGISHELPIYVTYGLTEMSSSVLISKKPSFENGTLFFKNTLPSYQVAISDENELLLKGPSLFMGYLNPDNTLDLPVNPKGWFCTKDMASFCPVKGFSITGRKDQLFISGGENIQPEEIEVALLSIPEIFQAQVVPVRDKEFGKRPVAFVSTKLSLEQITKALKEKLPSYKIPIKIFNLKDLDSGSVKWKRRELIDYAEKKISI